MSFNNRPDEPTRSDMFVKLVTENELRRENIKRFYNGVKNNAPQNTLSSYSVSGPFGGPEEVLLVHRVDEDGKHEYEIPLTRNLTPDEIYEIAQNLNHILTEGNFVFETSTFDEDCCIQEDDDMGVYMEPELFEQLATTLSERNHNKWLHERMKAGWRYGPARDDALKTHPLMKPWNQLSEECKSIDYEFPGFFVDLLDDFGYTIVSKDELNELYNKKK
jgi:hypothetical protein